MKFHIFKASSPLESVAWDAAISHMPEVRRDIHFTSAYGRVQEKQGGKSNPSGVGTR